MTVDEGIGEVDRLIRNRVNRISREPVVEEYKPRFKAFQNVALHSMKIKRVKDLEFGGESEFGNRVLFRRDGNFYCKCGSGFDFERTDLEQLPNWYEHGHEDKIEDGVGITDYHFRMSRMFNRFESAVLEFIDQ